MEHATIRPNVLIIDDDPSLLTSYTVLLEDEFRVYTAATGEDGLRILAQSDIRLILLDIRLPGLDGIEVLRQAKALDASVDVVMVTAVRDVRVAVEAMKLGAYDYLVKPFEVDEVMALLRRVLEHQSLWREVLYLRAEVSRQSGSDAIIGRSTVMQQTFDLVCRVAETDSNVLIHGESGTGKELIARAIHQHSPRRAKPFIAVNCAAISEHLLESEFFGHERGAFTGAVDKRLGKFELAHTGVLFLDEIASLRLDLQAKLLRVLQEREFERLGGSKTVRVDVRIVAASNQDLKRMVDEQTFRNDLFYRLNVVPIYLPPLRERPEDIPVLIAHFLAKYNAASRRQVPGFTRAALEALNQYHWPGNVRELENIIERLVAIGPQRLLDVQDLPSDLATTRAAGIAETFPRHTPLRQAKNDFERLYILQALEQNNWNQTETARHLRVHRNTLLIKMQALGIKPPSEI